MKSIGDKIKNLIENSKYTVTQVASNLGMTNQNLYKILKKDSVDSKILVELSKLFGVPISYFFDDQPLEPFGADMEQVQPGAGLGERLRVLSANLDKATQWQARAEQLAHDNEELRAMVDAQQRTIQAHEATIEALKDNITLLKEGKAQAVGRAKAVVRGGEGEA
jgi:transcriptional regulator with XRE-family HTH domain